MWVQSGTPCPREELLAPADKDCGSFEMGVYCSIEATAASMGPMVSQSRHIEEPASWSMGRQKSEQLSRRPEHNMEGFIGMAQGLSTSRVHYETLFCAS